MSTGTERSSEEALSGQLPAISADDEMNHGLSAPQDLRHKRIQPRKGFAAVDFQELWEFRELLFFFIWRDIKVRYKQTLLGAAWAVIVPISQMVVFSVFFGKLAGIKPGMEGVPYAVFNFAALLPWSLFAHGLTKSSNSLVANAQLIRKVYFPRLYLPASGVLDGVVDFVIAFAVLLGMMILGFGIYPTANIIWIPFFLLLAIVSCLGIGCWLSAFNVYYRDVRHVVPFLIQTGMFVSPVVFPSSIVEAPWRTLYAVNPMVGVIEGFRWALYGGGSVDGSMIATSASVAIVLFVTGVFFVRRMECSFVDVV